MTHDIVRFRVRSKTGEFAYYSCDSVVSDNTIHVIETVVETQPCDVSGNLLLKYDSGMMRLIGGTDSIPEYVVPVMGVDGLWSGDVVPAIGGETTNKIYVWGHEVMDFHCVDMMAIVSILTDSVKQLRAEVNELKRSRVTN